MMYIALLLIGIDRSSGPSPQSQTATLQFIIPLRVGVYVRNDVTWDFGSIPTYPPATFPAYYNPTEPASSPYMNIEYFTNAGSGTNWALTIRGAGDPGGGILIGDIEYADAGTNNWTALSTSDANLRTGTGKTSGWETANQDWRVKMTGDEEVGNYSTTVTVTMQTL
jgi:hypothetical protein